MRSELIREGLCQPVPAIAYSISERLRALFPDRALLQGDESEFDLDSYVHAGLCAVHPHPEAYTLVETAWDKGATHYHTANGWYEVLWQGHRFDVVLMSWQKGHCETSYYWIAAETEALAREFFSSVCAWCSEVRGEVLVFAGGHWRKDRDLYEGIQGATFANLILAGDLKHRVREDLDSFFQSRELYERYGLPWKRGILFIGPPGNGKTHAVKALINHVCQACLYVKSFKSQYATDHDNIRAVFKRARESTPCLLVLEDLDSLVDAGNRSFFLNEMDGFAANSGIVTLATTNHPERLDPSILDRPSRFDRKYHFDLPAMAEREGYLALWNSQLQAEMQLEPERLASLAALTEEFSFAYLKELVLSSLMRWISAGRETPLGAVMEQQVTDLRAQMSSDPEPEGASTDDEGAFDPAVMARMFGRRGRRMTE